MKAKDVMTDSVRCCLPDSTLDLVAKMMWANDCGAIPVVDDEKHPIGMLTDRDIVMGVALSHKALWEITGLDVIGHKPVHTCHIDDDLGAVLSLMETKKIRRVPVVDESGQLVGIVSLSDIIYASRGGNTSPLSYDRTMSTLKSLCTHHKRNL